MKAIKKVLQTQDVLERYAPDTLPKVAIRFEWRC